MGHNAGSRHDGGQGTLKARRALALKTSAKVLENTMRRAVREFAELHSIAAVQTLVDIMSDEDQFAGARAMAAREVLKIAEVYTPQEHGGAGSERPVFQINLLSVNGDLPRQVTVSGLPKQEQLSETVEPEPLDPEVLDVGLPQ
jgi:hypothetical protein